MKKGDSYYYGRVLRGGVFEVCDLKIVSVTDDYFTGFEERTGRTYLFDYTDLNVAVFKHRKDALEMVKMEESKYDYKNL